jgi:hypothetical protein
MRILLHEGVAGKARILERIRYDEQAGLPDGLCAESCVEGCFLCACSDDRLEPLPVLVNKGDDRNRGLASPCRDLGDIVECPFRLRIQDGKAAQGCKTICLPPRGV